ncbi:MAG TPA: DUF4173 domain-containing protein [Tissierellia bacterium]|nr:DUF4173 domain-containing protein [Tissierellia bacterium]
MEQRNKSELSFYGIISAITFIYLILTDNPGISAPIFFIIQFAILLYITKNNKEVINVKGLFMLLPIFIISLNNFLSASYMMMPTNFLVIVFLYSSMFLMLGNKLNLMKLNIFEILKTIVNIFEPIINFIVPFKWMAEGRKKNDHILAKRILIGVALSVPSVIFLIKMLSSADLVFYNNFILFNNWIKKLFEYINIFKIIVGTFAGFYLFSHLYSVLKKDTNSLVNILKDETIATNKIKGDIIVFNILIMSVLFVYSIFVVIQFKYLFSGGILPHGLSFSEYARRGFFELVFLSILNLGLILITTYLLRDQIYKDKNRWAIFTKLMLIYLCVITGILLVSSYYRMSLYDSAYGFTRLRVLVYIFLVFEAIGLIATFVYIIKHNFNILTIYAAIGLTFYLTLNVVKIDEIIAKRNIDMYLNGQAEEIDIDYLMTLSQDALPQLIRLTHDDVEIITRNKTINYLKNISELYMDMENKWQSYNLTIERNRDLLESNKDKWN